MRKVKEVTGQAAAKEFTNLVLMLGKTRSDEFKSGYALNSSGTYYDEKTVARLLELMPKIIAHVPDNEKPVFRVQFGLILKDVLEFEKAEKLLTECMDLEGWPGAMAKNFLARIAAHQGNLAKAHSLANHLNSEAKDAITKACIIPESELLKEHELGKIVFQKRLMAPSSN